MKETIVSDDPKENREPGMGGNPADFANPAMGLGQMQENATVEDGAVKILVDSEQPNTNLEDNNQPVVPE